MVNCAKAFQHLRLKFCHLAVSWLSRARVNSNASEVTTLFSRKDGISILSIARPLWTHESLGFACGNPFHDRADLTRCWVSRGAAVAFRDQVPCSPFPDQKQTGLRRETNTISFCPWQARCSQLFGYNDEEGLLWRVRCNAFATILTRYSRQILRFGSNAHEMPCFFSAPIN